MRCGYDIFPYPKYDSNSESWDAQSENELVWAHFWKQKALQYVQYVLPERERERESYCIDILLLQIVLHARYIVLSMNQNCTRGILGVHRYSPSQASCWNSTAAAAVQNLEIRREQKWYLEDHLSSCFLSLTFIIGQNLNLYHLTVLVQLKYTTPTNNRNMLVVVATCSSYYRREGRQRFFGTFCLFIRISSMSHQSQCKWICMRCVRSCKGVTFEVSQCSHQSPRFENPDNRTTEKTLLPPSRYSYIMIHIMWCDLGWSLIY